MKDARHYTLANVDAFWDAGNPVVLPIAGEPACSLRVDPSSDSISLTTPFGHPEPDVSRWRMINYRSVPKPEGALAELGITVAGNVHGAYSLLVTVADELQIGGKSIDVAVAVAIARHREIFAGNAALSLEKEIGLFGELLVLEHLMGSIGVEASLHSWHGPLGEEHDFVLPDVHLEVKTTSSERRNHVMHGFSQLVPVEGVRLNLVSVQITRSVEGGGRSLSQLVSHVRALAKGHEPQLETALAASGWRDDESDLYGVIWANRSQPRTYDVDDRFPAFTLERLDPVIPGLSIVNDLTYKIDITHFNSTPPPEPLTGFADFPKGI